MNPVAPVTKYAIALLLRSSRVWRASSHAGGPEHRSMRPRAVADCTGATHMQPRGAMSPLECALYVARLE